MTRTAEEEKVKEWECARQKVRIEGVHSAKKIEDQLRAVISRIPVAHVPIQLAVPLRDLSLLLLFPDEQQQSHENFGQFAA